MATTKRIVRLEEDVVNRIAAGEVIQRPANAIKEMFENALDAGASSISVVVKSGGLKMLQIQDDGHGINRKDMDIVCERFTTSKLTKFEDLTTIATHGFRGEALASISHVAHLSIISRTKDSPCAYKAHYRDGKLTPPKPGKPSDPKPCAGNQGTQITVEDLFFNVPTRRRALKSPSDELNRIMDIMSRYAVHNSGVGVSLKKHGETSPLLRTTPGATTRDNIAAIYGSKVANELLEIEDADEELAFKVRGFITNANYSVKKPTLLLFINHRAVHSTNIRKALDSVYAAYLPRHTHCFAYISLEIKPEHVDVNVHPTKKEVHFLHEEDIVERLQQLVSKRLVGGNMSRTFQTQMLLPGASGPRDFLNSSSSSSSATATARASGDGDGRDDVDARTESAQTRAARASTAAPPASAASGRRGVRDDGARVYDHDLIRTDAKSQTLDKFLSASQSPAIAAASTPGRANMRSPNTSSPISAITASTTAAATAHDDGGDDDDEEEEEMVWDPIRLKMRPRTKKKKQLTTTPAGAETTTTSTTSATATHTGASGQRAHVARDGGDGDESSGDVSQPPIKRPHMRHDGDDGDGDGCVSQDVQATPTQDSDVVVIDSGEQDQMSDSCTQTQQRGNTAASVGRPWPESHTQLTSILELRDAFVENQHSVLRSIFREHVFVGSVEDKLLLLQHQRHLYLIKLPEVCRVLFSQLCLRGFGDMSSLNLNPAAPVYDLILAALDSPDANWQPEDGPKPQLAEFITDFLKEKAEMLSEYFGLFVNQDGELERLPALLDGHTPDMTRVPTFLLRLATEVDWDDEKRCFETVAQEIGRFYASFDKEQRGDGANVQDDDPSSKPVSWLIEHAVAPALRSMFFPPRSLADEGAIVQIADLKELYKVFERC
ncbi:hypothetical protein PTSG_00253 [Salpingoeca rosetta]|uniref:DNA mismatch repair protein S5 domain-containing protein n=1 Tax=Salpingoeca rosetta (strain ATCC 50818 / BSB-021) TaxID=946362 RepID=F2TVY7_SALR5|nr:uncharacterized protein PTSG_00253 [Salpingoeca rosetta]EGD72233.1 hypothetical protein PTSG_00253 [Salpingoeca rosetta]|eukprot:XP_004998804.1 hypothetical protein PTSG_00253 [Salpingoeca rosetta]